jgi:competence ComEA-like helix-hairpin-helix protein
MVTRFAAALTFLAAFVNPVTSPRQDALPDEPGRDTVVTLCAACHDVDTVVAKRRSADEWRFIIEGMVSRGAGGTDAELSIVRRYLTRHFGTVNVNAAPSDELEAVLPISLSQAQAIVRHRGERGEFADLESLGKVPELSGSPVDAWKDRITFR